MAPEPGGTLTVTLADRIDSLDPLATLNRAERLASRQVFEPLRSWQSGPFGATRRRPGVARSFHPDADRSVWTARLRRGVSFQDGEPLDADAVIANVHRWTGSAAGRALLPALRAADSPRPGRIRFILGRPVPRFPDALSSPRLGLVAPAYLTGGGRSPLPLDASGTGPFEYRGREHDAVVLARNSGWWGAALGLGPGVDQVELACDPVSGHRLAGLLDGAVAVADDLGRNAAGRIADAPLLTIVRSTADTIGIERSVRGIDSTAAAQSLADVWLTDLR
jgi:MarR-like DNA-binding transcriptional regulator SgrR of sgrS sRNA